MYKKILAVTFGTELSEKAVKEGAKLAIALGAKLLVLHVRSPMDLPDHQTGGALSRLGEATIMDEIEQEEHLILKAAAKFASDAGIKVETAYIVDLSPYEAIIRVCEEQQCDLIVMATRIRHGIPGYLVKSQTQKVLENTDVPVLVMR